MALLVSRCSASAGSNSPAENGAACEGSGSAGMTELPRAFPNIPWATKKWKNPVLLPCPSPELNLCHRPRAGRRHVQLLPSSARVGCPLTSQPSSSGIFDVMRCPGLTELLAGSAMATAFPSSDSALVKPCCSGSVLWPARYLAALWVRCLLQPLLSKDAIFDFPEKQLCLAQQNFGDNPFSFHLPAGSWATSITGRDLLS